MFDRLKTARRLLFEVPLTPVQGDRFQPTGFADLGAAVYKAPDGTRKLLVESAQSMANRLEATIIGPDNEVIPELAGISYIRSRFEGASDAATNSLMEAHRCNSPYIISDPDFQKAFVTEADYAKGKPLNWKKVADTVFRYDVNALLHGVFMANLMDGRIKLPRSVSSFIEAADVNEAVSGGVKNNPIDPTGRIRSDYPGYRDLDVFGNVPYQRVEYTAGSITAYFNLDFHLLRSYGLRDDAFDLLAALALYKIQALFDGGLRLRTACDLKIAGPLAVSEPEDFQMPDQEFLLAALKEKIASCADLFPSPPVYEIVMPVIKTAKKTE